RASYFHNSLNGYHAAKMQRYQDVFDFYISQNNINVLNMFNTKYIIAQDEEGIMFPYVNPDANGNAWFIKEFKEVTSVNEEIQALDSLNNKHVAVLNKKDFNIEASSFKVDSTATITLLEHKPNYLKYKSINKNDGFAVFSEVYYPKGWKTIIDGKEASHIRVNYLLRGMEVPDGEHIIEFKFGPDVIQTGSTIALAGSILVGLLLLGGLYYEFKKK